MAMTKRNFRVDDELWARAAERAKKESTTITDLLTEALVSALEAYDDYDESDESEARKVAPPAPTRLPHDSPPLPSMGQAAEIFAKRALRRDLPPPSVKVTHSPEPLSPHQPGCSCGVCGAKSR